MGKKRKKQRKNKNKHRNHQKHAQKEQQRQQTRETQPISMATELEPVTPIVTEPTLVSVETPLPTPVMGQESIVYNKKELKRINARRRENKKRIYIIAAVLFGLIIITMISSSHKNDDMEYPQDATALEESGGNVLEKSESTEEAVEIAAEDSPAITEDTIPENKPETKEPAGVPPTIDEDKNLAIATPVSLPAFSNKEIVVVSGFKNTVRDGKQTGATKITLQRTGDIESAQVSVRASSNGKVLDDYSGAYVKMMTVDAQRGIGGHLRLQDSLVKDDSTHYSLFVYDMSSVPFRPFGSSPMLDTANWLETMNTYEDFKIYAFTSTLGAGEIEEIKIDYTCAAGSACSISLRN